MKEIEIQPIGSYFEIDKDGYVINPASLEKIQEKWKPVVTDVVNVYKNQFGELLKNVYIRGSVAKGQAQENVSDVDTFCYVDLPKEQIDNSWKKEEINKLKTKYPFIENAELICHSTSRPLNNILLNQSVCVYGEPVEVHKLKLGKEMMIHIPNLAERISMVEEKLKNSKSEETIKATCVWYMKDALRTGFELTMERSQRYTRDIYLCYKGFSEYYPEKEAQMREILHFALNPTSDLNKVKEIRNAFTPWLIEEVRNQSMNSLLVIRDKDIFRNELLKEDIVYIPRSAVKAIVRDSHGKIALVGTKYRLLPGGGVEEGETTAEAIKRECREEAGCNIEIDKEICFTEEYRARIGRHQQTHFFLAHVIGEKGKPETKQDDELGIEVDWYELDDAITLLEKEVLEIPFASYHSCFNVRTHLAVLKELKKSGI